MSNKELIERARIKAGVMEMGERIQWGSDTAIMREAADALELADKRIAELEARCRWHEEGSASIVGYPWETPFQDGLKTGRYELLDELDEAERKLSVAREAMQNLVAVKGRYHTEQAYNHIVETLAQIKGKP